MLKSIRETNDLGHPLCDNLRSGQWLPQYTVNRLMLRDTTQKLGEILSTVFQYLSYLPHYLVPCYFDAIISLIYQQLLDCTFIKMNQYVSILFKHVSIYSNIHLFTQTYIYLLKHASIYSNIHLFVGL